MGHKGTLPERRISELTGCWVRRHRASLCLALELKGLDEREASGSCWCEFHLGCRGGAFALRTACCDWTAMARMRAGRLPVLLRLLLVVALARIGYAETVLIVGGQFTVAGGTRANGVAQWDGSKWSALGAGMTERVTALQTFNNNLYAGGYFLQVGGVVVNRTARWDGTQWLPLGGGMDNFVKSFVVYNNFLVAGGAFVTAGGVTVNRIAMWNGVNWLPFGIGLGSTSGNVVNALAVFNNILIAGGTLTAGTTSCYLAQWNGASWLPLSYSYLYAVNAMQVVNNILIIGNAYGIVYWNGATFSYGIISSSYPVYSICPFAAQLIGGGNFVGSYGNYVTRFAAQSSSFFPLDVGTDGLVYALTTYKGLLIAGGSFRTAGAAGANFIATWDGSVWSVLGEGPNSAVFAITTFDTSRSTPTGALPGPTSSGGTSTPEPPHAEAAVPVWVMVVVLLAVVAFNFGFVLFATFYLRKKFGPRLQTSEARIEMVPVATMPEDDEDHQHGGTAIDHMGGGMHDTSHSRLLNVVRGPAPPYIPEASAPPMRSAAASYYPKRTSHAEVVDLQA